MESPIHAANEVDKGETVPKIIAGLAGLVIIVITAVVLTYSGFWSPPPTAQTTTQAQATK